MAFDPHIVEFLVHVRRSTMILHIPEMAITLRLLIPMNLQEVILWQLQHKRKQHKQLIHNLEMDMLCKGLNLPPVILYQFRMTVFLRILRCELRNVIDLGVIFHAVSDFADAEWFISVVAAVLEVGAVFDFLGGGEVEDLFAQSELAVDFGLGEAEVCDVEETCLRESRE